MFPGDQGQIDQYVLDERECNSCLIRRSMQLARVKECILQWDEQHCKYKEYRIDPSPFGLVRFLREALLQALPPAKKPNERDEKVNEIHWKNSPCVRYFQSQSLRRNDDSRVGYNDGR